ncbi:hypothetical protein QQ056_04050 [Oscillatoria laete-virens NRMC-F 0139]|nr:hypothetical protein [Oscillatoria laete-virens]MDL5052733.1 hypothetical protein [Oscillatoria laete-virens NRMC-F 0139]
MPLVFEPRQMGQAGACALQFNGGMGSCPSHYSLHDRTLNLPLTKAQRHGGNSWLGHHAHVLGSFPVAGTAMPRGSGILPLAPQIHSNGGMGFCDATVHPILSRTPMVSQEFDPPCPSASSAVLPLWFQRLFVPFVVTIPPDGPWGHGPYS